MNRCVLFIMTAFGTLHLMALVCYWSLAPLAVSSILQLIMAKLTNQMKGFKSTQDFPSLSISKHYLLVTRDNTRHCHLIQFILPPVPTTSHLQSFFLKEWNKLPQCNLDVTNYETFSNNLQQNLMQTYYSLFMAFSGHIPCRCMCRMSNIIE